MTITVYVGGLCLVALSALALSVVILDSSGNMASRLAELADVLTSAAVFIAVIAALIALQAYAVSTGLPVLQLQASFYLSPPNEALLRSTRREDGNLITVGSARQTELTVSVKNSSRYAARNIVLTITLSSLACEGDNGYPHGDRWVVLRAADDDGRFTGLIQWDDGSLIHGHATRVLPVLYLGMLRRSESWGQACLRVELLADGYRRNVAVPVVFWTDHGDVEVDCLANRRDWM